MAKSADDHTASRPAHAPAATSASASATATATQGHGCKTLSTTTAATTPVVNPDRGLCGCSSRLQYVVSAAYGTALGSSGLGGAFMLSHHALHVPLVLAEIFRVAMLVVVPLLLALPAAKMIAYPKTFLRDLQDPRAHAAGLSCGPMSLMVYAALVAQVTPSGSQPVLAAWIWRVGLWTHLALMTNFSVQRLLQLRNGSGRTWLAVTPAWFVTYVGICAGASSLTPGLAGLLAPWEWRISLYIGLLWLVLGLPFILVRLQQRGFSLAPAMDNDHRSSLAIVMAPTALCLSGWLATAKLNGFPVPADSWVTHALFGVAVLMTGYVWAHAKLLLYTLRPSPMWGAYTFPSVIVCVACMKYLLLFPDLLPLRIAAWLTFLVAVAVVLTTQACYVAFVFQGRLWSRYALYGEAPASRQRPVFVLRPPGWPVGENRRLTDADEQEAAAALEARAGRSSFEVDTSQMSNSYSNSNSNSNSNGRAKPAAVVARTNPLEEVV